MVRLLQTLTRKQRRFGTGYAGAKGNGHEIAQSGHQNHSNGIDEDHENMLNLNDTVTSMSSLAKVKNFSKRFRHGFNFNTTVETVGIDVTPENKLYEWCNDGGIEEMKEREQVVTALMNSGVEQFHGKIVGGKVRVECAWGSELTTLPPDLVLDELIIENARRLSKLPVGLEVKHTLRLVDCEALQELPSGLVVGSLIIIGNKIIEKLPMDMKISGELELIGCSSLKELPPRLNLKSLSIIHCPKLDKLPKKLQISGRLYLSDCPSLSHLPEGLNVWNLSLQTCMGIRCLPKSIKVKANISLSGCDNLSFMIEPKPEQSNVHKHTNMFALTNILNTGQKTFGTIDLRHSETIEVFEFPNDMKNAPCAYRSLLFQGCSNLKQLVVPDTCHVTITGDFNLRDCRHLISLPRKIRVEGNLILENCTRIRTLPAGLHVGGDLILNGCTTLSELPADIVIENKLFLKNCNSLKFIPSGLAFKLKGNFSGCKNLTEIPSGLRFNILVLKNCESLEALPEDTRVEDELMLGNCVSLKRLPNIQKAKDDCSTVSSITCIGCTSLEFLPRKFQLFSLNLSCCTSLKTLPEDLVVNNLNCSGCVRLKTMPKRLKACTVNLSGCIRLRELSEKLVVDRLNASNCSDLVTIPDGLHAHRIDLSGCVSLKTLPSNLLVKNDLHLNDCIMLQTIPNGVRVNGDLLVTGCTNLEKLPDGLHVSRLGASKCVSLSRLPNQLVAETVEVSDCINLTTLPEDLLVDTLLDLSGCKKLEKLPDVLNVRNLVLSGCESLKANSRQKLFLRGLHFNNSSSLDFDRLKGIISGRRMVLSRLDLSGCSSLKKFPSARELVVSNYIKLKNCTSLEELPAEMCISGDLDCSGCTSLKTLPVLLKAKSLYLRGCSNLESLPEELDIKEDLDISDCPKIWKLPDGLTVRNFKSSRCTTLKRLPKNMDVYTLNVHDCSSLEELPPDLIIRGDTIGLEGCINITSLPDISSWLRLSSSGRGITMVDIFLQGIGLFREDLNHIIDIPDVRIHYFPNGVMEENWQDRYKQKLQCPYLNLPVFNANRELHTSVLSEHRTMMGDVIEDPVVLVDVDDKKDRKRMQQVIVSYTEFMRHWLETGRGLYHNQPIPSILNGRLQRVDVNMLL